MAYSRSLGGGPGSSFRRTTVTLLAESGLPLREIADQLGHARVSVTQDACFGRHQASPKAAVALEVISEQSGE
jgi:integrase